ERALPVRLDDDEPGQPRRRKDAPAVPLAPCGGAVRTPAAAESVAVRRQLEPAVALHLRLEIAKGEALAVESPFDARRALAFIAAADAVLILDQTDAAKGGVPDAVPLAVAGPVAPAVAAVEAILPVHLPEAGLLEPALAGAARVLV